MKRCQEQEIPHRYAKYDRGIKFIQEYCEGSATQQNCV